MEKEQIITLAQRIMQGIATEEEKTLLHQWYDTWEDDEELVSLTEPGSQETLREKILFQLHVSLAENTTHTPVKAIRKRIQRLAAACILLTLTAGAGYYIYIQQSQAPVAVVNTLVKADAAPGGNKAMLTLGYGSTIVLDSAENGNLTQQGATEVVKTNDGELVYTANNGTTKPTEVLYNKISTPRGGQYQLTLPDGSRVWLNAVTTLRYPTSFTGAARKVELTGEAYFEVARTSANKAIPFIVEVNNIDVTVLGTHFNVNAYEDETDIKTTLLEGSVVVSSKQNKTQSLQLLPGQQSQWSETSGNMQLVKDADTEQAVAWKNGLFKFNSTNLATIMRQVARWYNVDIVYEGSVKEETFSGDMPRKEYASEVFKMLELTKTVMFTIENNIVTIKPYKK